MTYKIILLKHKEGYTVTVPALPGCISEGNTEAEAIENIKTAISEWVQFHQDESRELDFYQLEDVRVAEVEVKPEPILS